MSYAQLIGNGPAALLRWLVASRVLDLGVSIKDLTHIIEADFLFGSRQQELQRTGRLMHSLEENNKRHDIIMTQKEFNEYGKRLWALQEKGFTIKVFNYREIPDEYNPRQTNQLLEAEI